MKYRHSFHAGNFADVHKHIALLALLRALKKKDKGFLYLDTHAGRGSYDLSGVSAEAEGGVGRFLAAPHAAPELREYSALLAKLRARAARRHLYPGSPLIAAAELRAQDRAVLIELQGAEAHALERTLATLANARDVELPVRVERGDGFARLKAFLPPPERRGLTFLDPPYEETQQDFREVTAALVEATRRFPTGVLAAWYPIKDERTIGPWHAECLRALRAALALPPAVLASELWLYRRDSRVALNGSGLLIVNPPWLTLERMQVWLPELQASLAPSADAGSSARMVSESGR
ncbi:MAG TPA: 23S rRNA (adenine(2030)-N(6))-methyltransferase RlmJ [Steroidobacteraceae bacterium]|jgi:23S rRNA (adenine2030-N6)-methyltransferase|nr:23S rRNA (adenine(2030)-N(6))-methyltransferase RlmJ [Steroidobacteraceae bacterium]